MHTKNMRNKPKTRLLWGPKSCFHYLCPPPPSLTKISQQKKKVKPVLYIFSKQKKMIPAGCSGPPCRCRPADTSYSKKHFPLWTH